MRKIIKLLGFSLVLVMSACSTSTPMINYDPSKNNQQQMDRDAFECDLLAQKTYGHSYDIPSNFRNNCLRSKGWKETN
jgi:uncharacterized lipoprotein